jgi:phosphopantetheinyl transferase
MLKRKSGVEVSIAHCPKLMAVALSRGRVGIDCEMPKARRDWQGIADQFFTPEEAAAVACEGEGLFLHYWTMKEAFLKATRGELWADLNALTIEGQQILITNPESAGSQWHFWHREMEGSAVGACMEGDGKWRVEIYHCTVPGTIVRQGRK